MKTETWDIIIDHIGTVTGGWNHGFSVDVKTHMERDGAKDGYETERVALDRDRLIKADGGYDMDAVAAMVREHVGETSEVEIENEN